MISAVRDERKWNGKNNSRTRKTLKIGKFKKPPLNLQVENGQRGSLQIFLFQTDHTSFTVYQVNCKMEDQQKMFSFELIVSKNKQYSRSEPYRQTNKFS